MTAEAKQTDNTKAVNDTAKPHKGNGQDKQQQAPRVISNPNDVASLVLMQIDAVNAKKDELTIAMKNLTDTAKQLVRAYGEHTRTIGELKKRLEEQEK